MISTFRLGQRPLRSRARQVLGIAIALFSILPGALVMAASFQPVSRLSCPDGDFIVDAQPYAENEAGSSRVDVRYRYKGIELAAIAYEAYYKNLDAYLRQGDPPIYNLGLRLDTNGGGKTGGYDRGDTLYLPPAVFSGAEAERLSGCIAEHHGAIRSDFERAVITSSTFLGLMKTRAGIGLTGIARIVHADTPLAGIYGDGYYVVLVERGGKVIVRTNYTANSRPDARVVGDAVTLPDGSRLLRLGPRLEFAGQTRASADFIETKNRHGRRLKDDYRIEIR